MTKSKIQFAFIKMRAIFKLFRVRKLIGKPGVPYNRRLRVRGSPHPLNYDADLSFPAADSNAFRIHLEKRFTPGNWRNLIPPPRQWLKMERRSPDRLEPSKSHRLARNGKSAE
jgi:hypothetical protein